MAIAATVLDSGIDTTDASSYSTLSVSPAANSLLLVFAASSDSTLAPTITASGLGLTWTTQKDQPFGSSTTDVRRLVAFSAQCGASPGSGAITLSMSALSTHVAWVVIEVTGHDTTTPIPQAVGNKDDSTSATSLTVTLASPVSVDSRPFAWWGSRQSGAGTAEAGYTELYSNSCGSPTMQHEAEWNSTAFDTTPSITFPAQRIGGIALEVAAAAAGPVNGSVTAVTATANASAREATVSGETAVSTATWAQATALVLAPVVSGGLLADVAAVPAQATSAALAPVVGSVQNASVSAAVAVATAETPIPVPVYDGAVVTLVATASATAKRPTLIYQTLYTFEPPTYWQPAPPPPGVRRSLYRLRESQSVVRIAGTFQTVKTPSWSALRAAGEEGTDWFLGGHVYLVLPIVAIELTDAGYTVT